MTMPFPAALPTSGKVANVSTGETTDLNRGYDGLSALYETAARMVGGSGATISQAALLSLVKNFLAAQAAYQYPATVVPSGDTTGVTDRTALQAAINLGIPLRLADAIYYVDRPIGGSADNIQIYGTGGSTPSGDDSSQFKSTTIRAASGFSDPSSSSMPTGIIRITDKTPGTGGKTYGVRLRDLWIDGQHCTSVSTVDGALSATSPGAYYPAYTAPNSRVPGQHAVDGVCFFGAVQATECTRVGVRNCPGWGFACYDDPGDTSDNPDGQHFSWCLSQSNGGGFYGDLVDATLNFCHAQGCSGDGLYQIGGNSHFTAFRSDLSTHGCGFTIDHGGSPTYTDVNKFTAPSAQRNGRHDFNIVNSSATGTSWRMPVDIANPDLGGCGVDTSWSGTPAAIHIEGYQSRVTVTGGSIGVYTIDVAGGCPARGVSTATSGTGSGKPAYIALKALFINVISGGKWIDDGASVGGNFHIDPDCAGIYGMHPTSGPVNRSGSVSLVAGTATVSNDWVTSTTRVMAWEQTGGGTQGILKCTRSAGSVTFTSTSGSDTSTVAYSFLTA